MTDVMLIGVLCMPMPDDPADLDVMTWLQFRNRAYEAAGRIERDAVELRRLQAESEALRKDAARYARKRRIDYEKMVRQVGEDDAYFSEHVFNLSYDAAIDAALAARPGGTE